MSNKNEFNTEPIKHVKRVLSDRTLIRYGIFIVIMALILYVLYFFIGNIDHVAAEAVKIAEGLINVISPLIIGLVMAYIIDPAVTFFDNKLTPKLAGGTDDESKRIKREKACRLIAVIITYLIILTAAVLLIYFFIIMIMGDLIVGSISDSYKTVISTVQGYENEIRSWTQNIPVGTFTDEIHGVADGIMNWLSSNLSASAIVGSVSDLVGGVVNFVIGLIISIYLLIDKDFFLKFWNRAVRLIAPRRHETVNGALRDCDGVLSQFIRGILLDAVIVATLSSVALTVGGLEFGVFIGIVAGVCNIIPYFGPILGMVPAFIVGVLTDDIWQGVIAVVILLVIQQIDGNLIYPKVVGSSTGLHPLFVLLAVSIAGTLGGILWMILAVPVAGIIQLFVTKWATRREESLVSEMKAVTEENHKGLS